MSSCVFCECENSATISQCHGCGAPLPAGGSSRLEASVFQSHLLALVNQGEKIKAISAYQRQTGANLTAATEFIDALDRDQQFATARPIADVEWEIGKMLERGEKIDAIKVYRDRTGVGLKEAKDAVDALEIRLGLEPEGAEPQGGSGCFGMVLLVGVGSFWLTRYC